MFLTLKSLVWDENRKGFYSPSYQGFSWNKGDIASECVRGCPRSPYVGYLKKDCTCGIYSSPNWEALEEYHTYENSIIVFMQTFGESYAMMSPEDVKGGNAYAMRSWGVRIIGIVQAPRTDVQALHALALATDYFDVPSYTLKQAERLIRVNWLSRIGIDPYANDPFAIQRKVDNDDEHFEYYA